MSGKLLAERFCDSCGALLLRMWGHAAKVEGVINLPHECGKPFDAKACWRDIIGVRDEGPPSGVHVRLLHEG